MKHLVIFLATLLIICAPAWALDMRKAAVKARAQLAESLARQKEKTKEIQTDKKKLTQEIRAAQAVLEGLHTDLSQTRERILFLQKENTRLEKEAAAQKTDLDELSGAVRVAAGDLKALLSASMYTARDTKRLDRLTPILNTKRFPGMDDMDAIAELYFEESRLNGGIDLMEMDFLSGSGENVSGQVLTLGGFTAAFRRGDTVGFLKYASDTRQLYALPASPPWSVKKTLDKYMNGESDSVSIDISRGEALRQLTHRQSLKDQIRKGGLLVWPILALGAFAVFIGIERTFFLGRVHANTDTVMGRVNELAAQGEWEQCDKMVGRKKIPVYNVLRSGLNARSEDRETLESILQESILKELPRLERFLPMLNIMGAIAPLLGLLGTVTGMISTFHVITLYGTGDPKMMSGGISTALVTTMLGLSVAIPIMLLYTFLCRKVEHVIGDMEEKAVALTNIIFREVK